LDGCSFLSNTVQQDLIEVGDGTELHMRTSSIIANTAGGSVLSVIGAIRVMLTSTKFKENIFESEAGMIQAAFDKLSIGGESCGLYNLQPSGFCNGIYSSGICRSLPQCRLICVDTVEDLQASFVLINGLPPVVEVCAGTTLSLSEKSEPLKISLSGTELRCGSSGLFQDDCIVNGGRDQIAVKAGNVRISGFFFAASTRVSIIAQGPENSTLTVRNCHFTEHEGLAVILVVHEDAGVSTELDELRNINIASMNVRLQTSLIFDNIVDLSPIVSIRGSISVNDCVFQRNTGQASTIISTSESTVSIFASCFLGNTATGSTISLDQSASLLRNEDNFGIGNDAGICEGLNYEDSGCLELSSRFCTSTIGIPYDVFSTFTSCIADYSELSEALSDESSAINIQLCPGSTIDMVGRDPFQITLDDTSIFCGHDGSRLNECHLNGGESQITVGIGVQRVRISGVTFSRSTQVAVVLSSQNPLSIEFMKCSWVACKGESSVQIFFQNNITDSPTSSPTMPEELSDDVFSGTGADFFGQRQLEDNKRPDSALIKFDQCSFMENEVTSSLLSNVGALLDLQSCSFTSNTVGQALISSEVSTISISGSCFEDNEIDGTTNLVSSDGISEDFLGSNFQSNNNFLSSPPDEVCNGLFDSSKNECNLFDVRFCEAHLDSACFTNWEKLLKSVEITQSLGHGGTFTLCKDSTLFADSLVGIKLSMDNSVIQCGENGASRNRCVISGGTVPFHITGNATGIEFRGITFTGSTVAAIHAAGSNHSDVSLSDCIFIQNTGLAAVANYGGDIQSLMPSRLLRFHGRRLQRAFDLDRIDLSAESMNLKVERSIFIENTVLYSPLLGLGGRVEVKDTIFLNNSGASTALGIWLGGTVTLFSSCFAAESTEVPVFLGDGSTLALTDVLGEAVMSPETNCTFGAFNGSHCFPIDEASCAIDLEDIDIVAPLNGCVDNWSDLARAVMSDSVRARELITFTLCENTDFNASGSLTPIVVNGPDVIIQCGASGLRSGNCKIIGGSTHFKIEGRGRSTFRGISFFGATIASVLATGESSAIAVFHECVWEDNTGRAVLLIHKETEGEDILSIEDFGTLPQENPGTAMTALIDRSLFRTNRPGFAVITNNGGIVNILETMFAGNKGSRLGVLAAFNGAQVGVSFTCMNENTAEVRGIIYFDDESTIDFARNTHALGNEVEQDACNGIYFETSGSCLLSNDCQGQCEEFDIRTCPLENFEGDGTFSPTSSPTFLATTSPTANTTNRTSDQAILKGPEEEEVDFKQELNLALIVGLGVGIPILLCCCLPGIFIIVSKIINRGSSAVQPMDDAKTSTNQGLVDKNSDDSDSSGVASNSSKGKSTETMGSLSGGDGDDGLLGPMKEEILTSDDDDPLADLGSISLLDNDMGLRSLDEEG